MIDLVLKFLDGKPVEHQGMVIIPARPYTSIKVMLEEWLKQEGYSRVGEGNTLKQSGSMNQSEIQAGDTTNNDVDQYPA